MIYLITGPAGVGKSTISNKIAEKLERSVLIEGDDIYNLVVGGYVSPWKQGNQLELFWKNCKSLILNALQDNYDIVFNYILDKKQITDIKNTFGKQTKIKFVCLMVDEKTILQRDKLRPEDCQMGERCIVLLNSLKKNNFNKNNIFDTSNLTVDETYKEIMQNDKFII